ncbi:MAG: WG repeat-containing protein [Bacteroidetes bacterium]|nr:WG repeat-containing protein [Bacteroidota bacterium]
MMSQTQLIKTFTLTVIIVLSSIVTFAGDVDKAFKYLNTGDYINAIKYLNEAYRDEPENVAANYGLAKYYSLRDNKSFNLDSANSYIIRAANKIPLNPNEKQTKKYLALGVRDYTIETLKRDINRAAYSKCEEENSEDAYQHFINLYTDQGYLDKAINMRNQLAYISARAKNEPEALLVFINKYPKSNEYKEAKELYEKLLYEKITADHSYSSYKNYLDSYPTGAYVKEAHRLYQEKLLDYYNQKHDLDSYNDFLKKYPNHISRPAIEDSIYVIATASGTKESFADFINHYKDNSHIREAWENLYLLYTMDATEDLYRQFMEEFPEYPDRARVAKDMELAHIDLKPYQQGDKWGYAVQPTKDSISIIIPFQYEEAYDFHCGLAAVRLKPCSDRCTYFYIDKTDHRAIIRDFNYAGDFADGYAVAGTGNCEEDSCLYGIINKSGTWVVPPSYDELNDPTEGLYLVSKNERYGFINHSGKIAISIRYSDAVPFSEGVAAVALDSNWFFIDHAGVQLFFDGFHNVSSFHDSLCAATKDGINWGYINKEGIFVIQPLYESAENFENGYAIISKRERDPKYKSLTTSVRYRIDKKGKVIEKLTAPKTEKPTSKKRRKK